MPVRTIKVPPPIGGVNRALARSQQPGITGESLPTCWDALNVVPYDRFGRLRVSQRSGTEPVWPLVLGDGTQGVQFLGQVTQVNIPAVGGGYPDLTVSPSFHLAGNLASGNILEAVDANWDVGTSNTNTSAIATYLARFDGTRSGTFGLYPPMHYQTTGSQRFFSTSSDGTADGTGAAGSAAAFTTVAGTAADFFRVVLATNSGGSLGSVFLSVRVDVANPLSDQTGVLTVWVNQGAGTCALYKGTTLVTAVAYTDAQDLIGIQVEGSAVTVWAHDYDPAGGGAITLITATVAGQNLANRGIGFGTIWANGAANAWHSFNSGIPGVINEGDGGPSTPAQPRRTSIVAVVDGSVVEGTLTEQGVVTTGGLSVLSETTRPAGAAIFGKMYLVDGTTDMTVTDITTATTTTFIPTAGLETATTLGEYTIAAVYRGRLVLANTAANPQNFVCSRVGVPTDFDYAAGDPASAFAGNAAQNGQIGEPITALMPFSDDLMGIGGDHNLWVMTGDPAADGAIDNISDQIGVLGKDAWCRAPNGLIYFVGTGGFYQWDAKSAPKSLADTAYNQFFASINRATNIIQCVWDRDRRGCFIFVTSILTGASTHLWYDERTGGTYWPMQYPNSFGPISSIVYDGDGPDDRRIILGTRDGKLLQWKDNSRTDNDNGTGTAITAYVTLGPFHPSPDASKLIGTTFQFGELEDGDADFPGRWQCNVVLQAGPTAYDVTEGSPFQTATIQVALDRRTKTFRQRLRGAWFTVQVNNHASAQYFVLDDLDLEFEVAGKERRQR